MNLFHKLFSGKQADDSGWKEKTILCPVEGKVIPLSEVGDPVFAQGILGPGVGIEPEEGMLYAPVDGVVSAVYPTGHAIGLCSKDGMEILIHIGIDTVAMRGNGFTNRVKQGQKVRAGEVLSEFDIEKIRQAGHAATTMLVVTNANEIGQVQPEAYGELSALEPVCRIQ